MEAIRALTKSFECRRAMGDAGRRRVELFFDSAHKYGELIALIKSVADAREEKRMVLMAADSGVFRKA